MPEVGPVHSPLRMAQPRVVAGLGNGGRLAFDCGHCSFRLLGLRAADAAIDVDVAHPIIRFRDPKTG